MQTILRSVKTCSSRTFDTFKRSSLSASANHSSILKSTSRHFKVSSKRCFRCTIPKLILRKAFTSSRRRSKSNSLAQLVTTKRLTGRFAVESSWSSWSGWHTSNTGKFRTKFGSSRGSRRFKYLIKLLTPKKARLRRTVKKERHSNSRNNKMRTALKIWINIKHQKQRTSCRQGRAPTHRVWKICWVLNTAPLVQWTATLPMQPAKR